MGLTLPPNPVEIPIYRGVHKISSVRPSFYTFFGQVQNLARACELVLRLRTITVRAIFRRGAAASARAREARDGRVTVCTKCMFASIRPK